MATFIWDTRPRQNYIVEATRSRGPSVEATQYLVRYHHRTGYVPAADRLGHRTRMSDSSLYDEVCLTCGGTDARAPNDRLSAPCPQAVPDGVVDNILDGLYEHLL